MSRFRPVFFKVSGLSRRMRAATSTMRLAALCATAAGLAACAGGPNRPDMPVSQEEAAYRSHAKSFYVPPGPPTDPWGPYIVEASKRFDVPEPWIRAVIHQESGGHLYDHNGQFITSVPGAMGLMQLMPPTYDELKSQFNLGSDPYNPRDNILAGTAYIRQMYEIYGSPGFLAAYNYGPGSLDSYLRTGRALPRETRQYVANIGSRIVGVSPNNRSDADLLVAQYANRRPPVRSRAAARSAWRRHSRSRARSSAKDVQVAAAAAPRRASRGASKAGTSVKARLKRVSYRPSSHAMTWTGTTAAKPIPMGHRLKATPIKSQVRRSVSKPRSPSKTRAIHRMRRNPKRK